VVFILHDFSAAANMGAFDHPLRAMAEVKEGKTRHLDHKFTPELFACRQAVLQYRGFLRKSRNVWLDETAAESYKSG